MRRGGVGGAAGCVVALLVAAPAARAADPGEGAPPPREFRVGAQAHVALLQGAPRTFNPDTGYGFGVSIRRLYGVLEGMRLDLGVDLGYARFSQRVAVPVTLDDGTDAELGATQELSHTLFLGEAIVTLASPRRLRPWALGGGGGSVSYFFTPLVERTPREKRALVPVGRVAGGLDVVVARDVVLGAGVTYSFLSSSATISGARVFDDLLELGMDVGYSF